MIGIFDSGDGGLAAAREVRRLFQKEDIVLLADRKNAPYGTKTEAELVSLVKEDIRRLSEMGCEKILVACCTASTVFTRLSESEQKICVPIINPTAKAVCGSAHTAVIATERTVNSHAFSSEIFRIYPKIKVTEIKAQKLVGLIEEGRKCSTLSCICKEELDRLCEKIKELNADTLILGCTHFAHLEEEFALRLPDTKIINSAKEGALALKRFSSIRDKGRATVRYV